MKIIFGEGGTIQISEKYRCDYSIYARKYFVELFLDVRETDNHRAIIAKKYVFFRWEKFFGSNKRMLRWLTSRRLRRAFRKINAELAELGIEGEIDVSLIE